MAVLKKSGGKKILKIDAMAGVMHIGGRHSPLQWCAAALAVLGSLASYFDEDPEKPQKRTRVRKRSKKVESSSSESEEEQEQEQEQEQESDEQEADDGQAEEQEEAGEVGAGENKGD